MRVAITSLGMISPVGLDVVASAAAIRADVAFPSELEDFEVMGEDADAVPVSGHVIRDYTEGFHLFGRWIRMAAGCLQDLLAYGALPDRQDAGFWRATGLALATPVPDVHRFNLDEPWSFQEMADRYGSRLLSVTEIPISPEHVTIVPLGHAGVSAAVQQATRAIIERRLERTIVLGADSYVDQLTLEWLSEHGRLKTLDATEPNAVGLCPGESAACFLLESEPIARRRSAAVDAFIAGAAVGTEQDNFSAGGVSHGVGLAGVVDQVLSNDAAFMGDLITDLNGEEWRARELACARQRVGARLRPTRRIDPARSIGETGAASGAVAVCVAVRSFVRNYDSGGQALVTSSSEHGHVAALLVTRA